MSKDFWQLLIGVASGGVTLELIRTFLIPRVKKEDIATSIRDELREDIKSYKDEVHALRVEVDTWKKKYFKVIDLLIKNNINIPDNVWEEKE